MLGLIWGEEDEEKEMRGLGRTYIVNLWIDTKVGWICVDIDGSVWVFLLAGTGKWEDENEKMKVDNPLNCSTDIN